jgi:hypothetical protein
VELLRHGPFPVLQPRFDELDGFIMNLPDVLGLASTVHEPIFVPVVDATWRIYFRKKKNTEEKN